MMQKIAVILFFSLVNYSLFAQADEFLVAELEEHDGAALSLAFHPDSNYLASGGEDEKIIIWNLDVREPYTILEDHHFDAIQHLVYSRNGIFFSAGDRSLRVWDSQYNIRKVLTGHHTFIWSFDVSPDEKSLVSGAYEKKIRYWDYTKTDESIEMEGHDKSVLAVAFSPDGKYIASGSLDETIKIWDAKSRELVKTMEGHSDNIYELKFLRGSEFLVSVSRDKTIRLWDIAEGTVIRTFPGHKQGIFSVDVSPDEKTMLTASFDGEVKLWGLANANNVYTFKIDNQPVNCVRYSPDGKSFATASQDGTVRLWELAPSIFVNYYFESEIQDRMNESDLFLPKQRGESRSDYKIREEKAAEAKKEMFEELYQKYLKMCKEQTLR